MSDEYSPAAYHGHPVGSGYDLPGTWSSSPAAGRGATLAAAQQAQAPTPFRGTLSTVAGALICDVSGMLRPSYDRLPHYHGHLVSLVDRLSIERLSLAGETFRLELECGASLVVAFTRVVTRNEIVFQAEFEGD